MWKLIKKRKLVLSFAVFLCLSVLAVGTYAWFSIMQNLTNEFAFEPYSIRLTKESSDRNNSVRLAGAVFGLYNAEGEEQGRYITDQNGEINLHNLPDGEYYFKELYPPYGYEIIGDGKTKLFSPPMAELVVENNPLLSALTIHKSISETDFSGKPYTITEDDRAFPFQFTVTIGDDPNALYSYVINDANGKPLTSEGYSYTFPEDGSTIVQTGSGSIAYGGILYLRHGETAFIDGIAVSSSYRVTEKNYLVYENPDFRTEELPPDLGCKDNIENGHSTVLTKASGWASEGYNTTGSLREDGGSVASFVNIRVPENFEITISSLAVVDRILANPRDIDYGKGFEVTVEIGDAADDMEYWYEVVHLEDTTKNLSDYNYLYDYYDRNDPGVPKQMEKQPVGKPTKEHFFDNTLTPPAAGQVPGSPSHSGNLTLPEIPESYAAKWLHRPTNAERWPQRDKTYPDDNLMLSGNPAANPKGSHNRIVAELHHGSALIIYGIPVGTHYTVSQVNYRYIDGYILDSTHKDAGVIQPDLEVTTDQDTDDTRLLRTRADIYNYFVQPIMRELTIKKHWEHGTNPPENHPDNVTIQLRDPETAIIYDSRTYRSIDEWTQTVLVPQYRPGTNELIDYDIVEQMPPGYIMGDIVKTEDGFQVTNNYQPAEVKPAIHKVVKGITPPDENFVFRLIPGTPNTPMPDNTMLVIRGAGYHFFDSIRYHPTGSDGTRIYNYRIQELEGTTAGYTYDDSVYTMTVTVVEQNGQVQATPVYKKEGKTIQAPLPFVNSFRDVERSSLTITKTVTGNRGDRNKLFDFLVEIDGYPDQTFRLKHGESVTIPDLPVGTYYTVTERNYYSEGYSTTVSGSATGTIPPKGATASFINRKDAQPGVGSLELTKRVTGAGGEKDRDFRFTVKIGNDSYTVYLKDGEVWKSPPYSAGTSYTVTESNYSSQGYVTISSYATGTLSTSVRKVTFVNQKDTVGKGKLTIQKQVQGIGADTAKRFSFTAIIGGIAHKLTLAADESYTFYDIPLNAPYKVVEQNYADDGYLTESTGSVGTITADGSTAIFTNTKTDNIDPNKPGRMTVTKTVTGKFIDATKKFRFVATIGDTKHEFWLRHGESKSFDNIPPGTAYSVEEDDYAAQDYVTGSTGAVGTMSAYGATAAFTNEYTSNIPPKPGPDAVQISGVKTWVHGNNALSNQPKTLVVYVMSSTKIVVQKTVTAVDNWSYAFNLPKFDANGTEIVYSVNEQAVKNYIKTIQGYDISNTYNPAVPETGDANRLWIWFVWLAVGAVGLRYSAFYQKKRRPPA